MTDKTNTLSYVDHEGMRREIRSCSMTVDHLNRHWIWCDYLDRNLAHGTKGRENALLAAIDSLLFTLQLRDECIAGLQRIADLAERFAEEAFPSEGEPE